MAFSLYVSLLVIFPFSTFLIFSFYIVVLHCSLFENVRLLSLNWWRKIRRSVEITNDLPDFSLFQTFKSFIQAHPVSQTNPCHILHKWTLFTIWNCFLTTTLRNVLKSTFLNNRCRHGNIISQSNFIDIYIWRLGSADPNRLRMNFWWKAILQIMHKMGKLQTIELTREKPWANHLNFFKLPSFSIVSR